MSYVKYHAKLLLSIFMSALCLIVYVLIIVVFSPLNVLFRITDRNVGSDWMFFCEKVERYMRERGWL